MGHKLPEDNAKLFTDLESTPFGNELIEAFAERALEAEQLGTRECHRRADGEFLVERLCGAQVRSGFARSPTRSALETDRLFDKLFQAVERQVGADNYVVVLTADHGVSPVPEVNVARKMPGGRIDPAVIKATVQSGAGEEIRGGGVGGRQLGPGGVPQSGR